MIWLSKEALTPYGDNGVKLSVYHKFSKIISNKIRVSMLPSQIPMEKIQIYSYYGRLKAQSHNTLCQ